MNWAILAITVVLICGAAGQDPWDNWQRCNNEPNMTRSEWICDPENLLSIEFQTSVRRSLLRFQTDTSCQCPDSKDCTPDDTRMKNSYRALLVLYSQASANLQDVARRIYDDARKEEKDGIHHPNCDNGIVILYDPNNQDYTVYQGNVSRKFVPDSNIRKEVDTVKQRYGADDTQNNFDGLRAFLNWLQKRLDFSGESSFLRNLVIVSIVCGIIAILVCAICCVVCCHIMFKDEKKPEISNLFTSGIGWSLFPGEKQLPLITEDISENGTSHKNNKSKKKKKGKDNYYTVSEPSTIYAPLSDDSMIRYGGPPPMGLSPMPPPPMMPPPMAPRPPYIISPAAMSYSGSSGQPSPMSQQGLLALPEPCRSPQDGFMLGRRQGPIIREIDSIYGTGRPPSRPPSETQSLRFFITDEEKDTNQPTYQQIDQSHRSSISDVPDSLNPEIGSSAVRTKMDTESQKEELKVEEERGKKKKLTKGKLEESSTDARTPTISRRSTSDGDSRDIMVESDPMPASAYSTDKKESRKKKKKGKEEKKQKKLKKNQETNSPFHEKTSIE